MKKNSNEWLSGIVPPMITPLQPNGKLDMPGLERLVEHLIAGGVNGIFVLGTTGEGPSLGLALRRELIGATVRLVAGRVPVLVGITDSSLHESFSMAQFAADAGAQAVVASTPFYFQVSQEELLKHVEQIATSVQLPLVLYNIPQLTKTWFEIDTVRRAFEFDNVIGIKDSSGDTQYFDRLLELVAERDDCSLLLGPEEKLSEAVYAGAHGGVCGGANLFPKLFVDLYEASLARDNQRAAELQKVVMQVSTSLYGITSGNSSFVNAIKESLSLLGICQKEVALPFCSFSESESAMLLERLCSLGNLQLGGVQSVLKPLLSEVGPGQRPAQLGHAGFPRPPVHLARARKQSSTSSYSTQSPK